MNLWWVNTEPMGILAFTPAPKREETQRVQYVLQLRKWC